jgi:dienelactone hydrolase
VTQIALFHSVLGVRPGVTDAAARLRAAGHQVLVADLYAGETFGDYGEAGLYVESIGGYSELMRRAEASVRALPDGFVAAGFASGAGVAEYVATRRRVGGVVMISGALPVELLGTGSWPAGVPAQVHYTTGDPLRRQQQIDSVAGSVRAADARAELFDYPGAGHQFTEASLADEYQPAETALLWERVLAFAPLQPPGLGE